MRVRLDVVIREGDELHLKKGADRQRVAGLAPEQPVPRILVAEDVADSRILLARLLSMAGFEVREAANGQEAVTIAAEWRPRFIWMDVRMPVMNGMEATRIIKGSEAGRSITIAALTAHSMLEDDGYSHLSGDQVLIALAQLLAQRLRKADVLGRIGGEDFLAILPGCPPAKAVPLLDQLRESFAAIEFQADGKTFTVTFSCGVALVEGVSIKGIYPYAAKGKAQGKNRLDCHNVAEGAVLGAVTLSIPLTDSLARIRTFQYLFGGLGLLGIALLTVVVYVLARRTLDPLEALAASVSQVKNGNLAVSFDHQSADEIGTLSTSVKEMVQTFRALIGETSASCSAASPACAAGSECGRRPETGKGFGKAEGKIERPPVLAGGGRSRWGATFSA